jgi:hypothetical protein
VGASTWGSVLLEEEVGLLDYLPKYPASLMNKPTVSYREYECDEDQKPLSADLGPGESAYLSDLKKDREQREQREATSARRLTEEEAREVQKLIAQGMQPRLARAAVLKEPSGLFADEGDAGEDEDEEFDELGGL